MLEPGEQRFTQPGCSCLQSSLSCAGQLKHQLCPRSHTDTSQAPVPRGWPLVLTWTEGTQLLFHFFLLSELLQDRTGIHHDHQCSEETCYQKEKDRKRRFSFSIREPISWPSSPPSPPPFSPSTQLVPLPSRSTPNWKSADHSLSQRGFHNIPLSMAPTECEGK